MKTMSHRLITACGLVALLFSAFPAEAELAIFTDGRVLKVEDAYLEGAEIVLELVGGGTVRVPALRIDRVIADEVADRRPGSNLPDASCPAGWTDRMLPAGLPYRQAIEAAARANDLDPLLLAAIVQTESDFDPEAVSRAGASGLMQLMPAAAADRGVHDVFDPEDNLRGGAAHLRIMLDRFRSLTLALAAYNAGATTVDRYDGVPPYRETRDYVRRVIDLFCFNDDRP
jgi:soluble lytic murein transglycosylase-like protein